MEKKHFNSLQNQIKDFVMSYFTENKKISYRNIIFDIQEKSIQNMQVTWSEETNEAVGYYKGAEFLHKFEIKFHFLTRKTGSNLTQKKEVLCKAFEAKFYYDQESDNFVMSDGGHISIINLDNIV